MKLKIVCKYCDADHDIDIDMEKYDQWKKGTTYFEDAFADLEKWEREMIISRTCDNCWKKFYGSYDNEVYDM